MVKLTSREFNQDTAGAKRSAKQGPVFITDRGEPAFVLLTIDEYRRLARPRGSIINLLGVPSEEAEIDFDPPRLRIEPRDVDLS